MKYISRLTALLLAVMLMVSSAGAMSVDDLTLGTMNMLYESVSEDAYTNLEAGVLGEEYELEAFADMTNKALYSFQWYDVDGNALPSADNPWCMNATVTMEEQQFYCVATDADNVSLKSAIMVLPAAQTTVWEEYVMVLYTDYEELYWIPDTAIDEYLEAAWQWMQLWNVTLEDGSNLAQNVYDYWVSDPYPEDLLCTCAGIGNSFCILAPDADHDAACGWSDAVRVAGEVSALSIETPDDAFSAAYEVYAESVTDADLLQAIDAALQAAMSNKKSSVSCVDAYDIHFEDQDGNKLQPSEAAPITLTFTMPTEAIATTHADGSVTWPEILGVFHVVENGAGGYSASLVGYTETVDPDEDTQTISVETTEFSIYVVGAIGTTEGKPAGSKLTMNVGETVILYSDFESPEISFKDYLWDYNEENNCFTIERDQNNLRYVKVTANNAGSISLSFCYWGQDNRWKWITGETVEIEAVSPVTVTFKPNAGTGDDYTITTTTGVFVFPTLEEAGIKPPEGAEFGGWGTESGNNGQTYAAHIEGKTAPYVGTHVDNDKIYHAQWFYPGTGSIGNGWHEVYFFVRKDGAIQAEPANYGNTDYYPGGVHAEYNKGYIYTAIEINNNLAAVKANIAEEPTPDEIRQMGIEDFDENTQEVVWYVIKQQSPWHVDGVLRDKTNFEVAYHPNGGDTNYPGSNQHTVGSTITVDYGKVPRRVGYVFRGWDENPDAGAPTYDYDSKSPASFIMPPNNVDLYAIWRPSDATKYTVEHYLCDVDGNNAQLAADATQIMYGTTEQMVTAGYLTTFAGYEAYPGHEDTKRVGTIAADGTLVLKLYYKLVCSTLTIKKEGMSTTDGESAIFEVKAYTKTKGDAAQETFIVVVPNGGKAVIGDLLIGKEYTVKEITDWTWRYTSGDPVTGTIAATGSSVTFTNRKQTDKWLSDESSVTNNMNSGYINGYHNE